MTIRYPSLAWLVVLWLSLVGWGYSTALADQNNTALRKTWKVVAELSDEEQAVLDFQTDAPRDATVPYLPAERFPFQPPYTAEEMAIRAMEFPHSPFWNCTLIDMAFRVYSKNMNATIYVCTVRNISCNISNLTMRTGLDFKSTRT